MNRHDAQHDLPLDAELTSLDAALRLAMPVAAPRDLVRRIEVAAGVYDPALDAQLRRELGVDVPMALIDDVIAACGLADESLDRALRATLVAGPAPAGLIDRIDAATTDRMARPIEVPAVIGRIGFAAAWRGAAAAAILAAASVALIVTSIKPTDTNTNRPGTPGTPGPGPMTAMATPTLDEQIRLFNYAADATDQADETDALAAGINAVESEIDDAAVAMTVGSIEDSFGTSIDLLDDELDLLEARIESF